MDTINVILNRDIAEALLELLRNHPLIAENTYIADAKDALESALGQG
jgi:hypothetical protein